MRMKSLVSTENATGAKQWIQSILVVLFALPFAGVGVFMAGWVVRDVWTYNKIQSWEATPATLLEAELKGEGSQRATARYRYEVDGKERSFEVKSLISWRGEWYVVHLSGFK